MLSNNLTVEDEEAVQAELRQLQREQVSHKVVVDSRTREALSFPRQLGEPELPVSLPSVLSKTPLILFIPHPSDNQEQS